MYKIGEFIVYNNEGVCEVENISKINIPGTNKINNYYTLKPMHGNGTVFIPVETDIFMRPILNANEIENIVKNITVIDESEYDLKNAKVLQEHYKKLLNTHECIDTLTVMVSLDNKKIELSKDSKRLGQIEEKFLRISKDLIEDEFSIALNIQKEEVNTYIRGYID